MAKSYKVLDGITPYLSDSQVLSILSEDTVNHRYLETFKHISGLSDDIIAYLLGMSLRSYQDYKKKPSKPLSTHVKEVLLLLFSIYKHADEIFSDMTHFKSWLTKANTFFDSLPPYKFMNTVSGIRFVDQRLTAMEYGDNV